VVLRAIPGLFLRKDNGQGLSEYCLLTALIAIIALGLFIRVSGGVQSIWSGSASTFTAATGATTGAATGATTGIATSSNPDSH
jgi:Flp pilus assembly pilin Flp